MFYEAVILCVLLQQISLTASQGSPLNIPIIIPRDLGIGQGILSNPNYKLLLKQQNSLEGSKPGCEINIHRDFGKYQGLLLKPGYDTEQFDAIFHPDENGNLRFFTGQMVFYECPDGYLKLEGLQSNFKAAVLTCVEKKTFELAGRNYFFVSIACTKHPKPTARNTGKTCLKYYDEVEIGFWLSTGTFLNHIKLCFDDNLATTLYTIHKLTKSIEQHQITKRPSSFYMDGFCVSHLGGDTIEYLYKRPTQRKNINYLLGLPTNSNKYLNATGDYYFARGHYTAKTDFIYTPQQRLTFFYINAAPQWQTINNGNWLALENSVRKFSSDNSVDLIIYTGPHGILKFPHEDTGDEIELFLYSNAIDEAVPVPQLFWKVVYEPVSKTGIAFIVVNNPHVKKENIHEFIKCTNICDGINWNDFKNATVFKLGYLYCCSVPDFRKNITLPEFEVTGILMGQGHARGIPGPRVPLSPGPKRIRHDELKKK